jgi:hypothetical protein
MALAGYIVEETSRVPFARYVEENADAESCARRRQACRNELA